MRGPGAHIEFSRIASMTPLCVRRHCIAIRDRHLKTFDKKKASKAASWSFMFILETTRVSLFFTRGQFRYSTELRLDSTKRVARWKNRYTEYAQSIRHAYSSKVDRHNMSILHVCDQIYPNAHNYPAIPVVLCCTDHTQYRRRRVSGNIDSPHACPLSSQQQQKLQRHDAVHASQCHSGSGSVVPPSGFARAIGVGGGLGHGVAPHPRCCHRTRTCHPGQRDA